MCKTLPVVDRTAMFVGQPGLSPWAVGPGPGHLHGGSNPFGDGKGDGGDLGPYKGRSPGGPSGSHIPLIERRVAAALTGLSGISCPMEAGASKATPLAAAMPRAAAPARQADTAATAMAVLPFLATGGDT